MFHGLADAEVVPSITQKHVRFKNAKTPFSGAPA
jgi:hypothetical protein